MPDAGETNAGGRLSRQMLPVGDGHEIYFETVGNADGIPAVYLHGGPGSGCQPDHRRLFDQQRVHAVLFDQRGAGLSRPKGSRQANTTAHLVADMEKIRETLDTEDKKNPLSDLEIVRILKDKYRITAARRRL